MNNNIYIKSIKFRDPKSTELRIRSGSMTILASPDLSLTNQTLKNIKAVSIGDKLPSNSIISNLEINGYPKSRDDTIAKLKELTDLYRRHTDDKIGYFRESYTNQTGFDNLS